MHVVVPRWKLERALTALGEKRDVRVVFFTDHVSLQHGAFCADVECFGATDMDNPRVFESVDLTPIFLVPERDIREEVEFLCEDKQLIMRVSVTYEHRLV